MSVRHAARIARRELRGGLAGFRVFLICLALGVAAIAAVGSVRVSITEGLAREGAALLGGDAELRFTYRFAEPQERAVLDQIATQVSEVVDFRSMAVVDRGDQTERGLTQVKGVDGAYPLYGRVTLTPEMPLDQALAGTGALPGAVMERLLIDRLALQVGEVFRLGTQEFVLMAALTAEPDRAGDGFGLGPRTIVRTTDLAQSSLLAPGTLFETKYRLALPAEGTLDATAAAIDAALPESGGRWRDSRNGAPGVQQFVDRLGSFLVLVGLAGLAVGGVGVSAAVRSYLAGKTATIATLRTLGADRQTIFLTYLGQIAVLSALGLILGLALGAGLPLLLAPVIEAQLPLPIALAIYPAPLAEAALYGALTALIFALWPLAQTENIKAAALFRDALGRVRGWPRPVYLLATGGLAALLVGAAALLSGVPMLALYTAGGIAGALIVLALMAGVIRWAARHLARTRVVRGIPRLRLALAAIGGPQEEAGSVILSLGLGLTVLATVGQIDANLRGAIERDLPEVAPSYFFVDIQNDQMPWFLDRVEGDSAVSRVDHAPMLRGIITQINGQPAGEVVGDHWVLSGDRGVTYSAEPTAQTTITEGDWWPADYTGPPQISFAAEEAAEMGLSLGDEMTINILGRDITGTLTSFRVVDFSTAGIGFILSMNPSALAGAPHTHIATVYADEAAEAQILRDISSEMPNVTAVRVKDAIDQVAEILAGLAAAIRYGAAATLLTGFVVLIGAAAASERARVYEAAILKTLGGARGWILSGFALRSGLLGLAAGGVALICGALAGWAVSTFVMETEYRFDLASALWIILGGIGATLVAGLAFAWRPLAAKPARILRARD